MWPYRYLLITVLLLFCSKAFSQKQDLTFHLTTQILRGKIILKVKWDISDPYLWVLAKNNEVYRVNTTTLAVDDFSSKFAAFSDQQFIDIAGLNQDSVWLASRSKLIQCLKGVAGLSSLTDNVKYPINSIEIPSFSYYTNGLLIGTDLGGYFYQFNDNSFHLAGTGGPFKIFGSTYRRLIYSDYSSASSFDITKQVPVIVSDFGTRYYRSFLQGGIFGSTLTTNTAFYSNSDLIGIQYNSNIFWGNSNGMFQVWNNPNGSYGTVPFKQSLNGITVNKITDIYGLTSIRNTDINNRILNKENLLIGTSHGFYFSTSLFGNIGVNELTDFSLFHFDGLGSLPVNDICVTGTAKAWLDITTGCENEVWLGTNDGLCLLIPDYGKYLDTSEKVWAAYFDLPDLPYPDTLFSTKICAGSSIDLKVSPASVNNNLIQWKKDGTDIPGATSATLTVKDSGDYNAVLYLQCENVHVETNHLKVQVISGPVFSFNYPDKIQYCDSASTELKTDNTPGYRYRWYSNGVLNGTNTYKYTVTQSGKYKVEVSACTDNWVSSKEVEVDLVNLPVPAITADKPQYCAGETATLSLNTLSDPSYTINWYEDGSIISADQDKTIIPVTTGGKYTVTLSSTMASCTKTSVPQQIVFTPAPVFTFNYPDELRYCTGTPVSLKADASGVYQYRWYKDDVLTGDGTPMLLIAQSGKYKVEVSSCPNSWVPSKEVQVDLIDIPVPVITTDKPGYCTGDIATLSIAVPANPNYTINWYKDNVLLSDNTNQTSINVTTPGSFTVTILNNQANTDGTTCSQTSVAHSIIFNPPPTVSIKQIIKTTLCDGQTVDLKISYDSGTVKWSTGETSDRITVSNSGSYTASVATSAGCSTDQTIDVQFFPNPALHLPDAVVCVPSHQTTTLTAPAGMRTYVWNGQNGINTFVVDHPQMVTLTVTDNNGCQATQQIQISDGCPDVKIPNAFTPNGDGINDTWVIAGLEYDPTALVRVFDRYGQQVFQSKGYGTPWNGTYRGSKLPTGAYYYIINVKNNSQTFSGEVTIVY
jgi:gliding motility-associated-like protein